MKIQISSPPVYTSVHTCFADPSTEDSVQESRGSKNTHETKFADQSRRRRQCAERDDVHAEPTLHRTTDEGASGETEEGEGDGARKCQVLLAQKPDRTQESE